LGKSFNYDTIDFYEFEESVNKDNITEILKFADGLNEGSIVVIDFKNTEEFDHDVCNIFHQFKQKLKLKSVEFTSVNINNALSKAFKNDRILDMFNAKNEPIKGPIKYTAKTRHIDINFIIPFVEAAKNVLKIQANIVMESEKPFEKESSIHASAYDIVGLISIVSSGFNGNIALCFPEKTFLNVCEGMLGEKYEKIDEEVEDAAGELLNIIFGVAKGELNDEEDYQIEMAIPIVLRAPGIKVKQTVGPTMVLPFKSLLGNMFIEIELVEK
jgi:CheY-specific phosphatase CheX